MAARGRPPVPEATVTAWRSALAAGATIRAVAAAAGVNPSTVRRHVGSLGRPPGPRPRATVSVDDVVNAYRETGSYQRTAEQLGVSTMTVRDRLWRAGHLPDPTGRQRPRRDSSAPSSQLDHHHPGIADLGPSSP